MKFLLNKVELAVIVVIVCAGLTVATIKGCVVVSCCASTVDEFAFLILLEEVDQPVKSAKLIIWQDYRKQSKLGWPRGAVVYVSSPNCRACQIVEKDVFTDQSVINELNKRVVIKFDPKLWRLFQSNGRITTPSLVFIDKEGNIERRVICPQNPTSFLREVRK